MAALLPGRAKFLAGGPDTGDSVDFHLHLPIASDRIKMTVHAPEAKNPFALLDP